MGAFSGLVLAVLVTQAAPEAPPSVNEPAPEPVNGGSSDGRAAGPGRTDRGGPAVSGTDTETRTGTGAGAAAGPDDQKKLDQAVEALRAELANSQERVVALEDRVAELEAREAEVADRRAAEAQAAEEERVAREESPAVRAESFGAALGSLDTTLRNLAAGDGAAAAAQLDAIRGPLLEARAEAGRFDAGNEAAAATTALQALDAAQAALARGDLWAARVAATLAAREAAAANALASQGSAAKRAY